MLPYSAYFHWFYSTVFIEQFWVSVYAQSISDTSITFIKRTCFTFYGLIEMTNRIPEMKVSFEIYDYFYEKSGIDEFPETNVTSENHTERQNTHYCLYSPYYNPSGKTSTDQIFHPIKY